LNKSKDSFIAEAAPLARVGRLLFSIKIKTGCARPNTTSPRLLATASGGEAFCYGIVAISPMQSNALTALEASFHEVIYNFL
jgi:hypothetical protein